MIYVSEDADISDGIALLLKFCQLGWLYHGHLDEPGGEAVEDSSVLPNEVYVRTIEGNFLKSRCCDISKEDGDVVKSSE